VWLAEVVEMAAGLKWNIYWKVRFGWIAVDVGSNEIADAANVDPTADG
jgi:hypothetical protein